MDECQSSHIENIMTRLTTIKCDKKDLKIFFSPLVELCIETYDHNKFADLAL